jgi:hypothetical protein
LAETKKAAPVRNAAVRQSLGINVDPDVSGEDLPGVTDPTDQQVTVFEPAKELSEGEVISMRAAAQYAAERSYGPKMVQIFEYIASHAVDTADLNVVILEQLAARILDAEDPDDILDPFGTVKGKDVLGKPLQITGVQFLQGEFEESFPYYVSFQVYDAATQGVKPVTVGGEKVVLQAAGFDMHGAWPQVLAIHKAEKATRNGFYPLELRRPV